MNKKSVSGNGTRASHGGRVSLGEAAEDGLKAIYKLQAAGRPVPTSALAAALGVTEPTATAMIKRLARLGLLHHAPYHGVELTAAGEAVALEIIRHHRLLEAYLVKSLGLSWESVHAEAERLEHVISEDLEDRLDEALGHPASDPHGDPIPSRDGTLGSVPETTMADLEPGQRAMVRLVPDGDPDLLRYLAGLGLVPGAEVELLEKAPFRGPLVLAVGGERLTVGIELAEALRVDRSDARGIECVPEEVTDGR